MVKTVCLKIMRYLLLYNLPKTIEDKVMMDLMIINPIWQQNNNMGRRNWGVEKHLVLFELKNKRLKVPVGYLDDVLDLLSKSKIKFDLINKRKEVPCKIEFNGKPKDFQKPAIKDMLNYNMGTLCAPTGSGKTVMALIIIAVRKQKTLVIVHTKDLLYQWIERATDFLSVEKEEIGIIGNGCFKVGNKITIGLVQTINKNTSKINKQFGMVVIDECHRTPSKTFSKACNSFYAKYMLGLSATPYRRDNLSRFIFLYVGQIRHKIEKKDLEKKGHIVKAQYFICSTKYKTELCGSYEYTKMISELTMDVERNKQIAKDMSSMHIKGHCCLVLTDRKEHCRQIKTILADQHNIHALELTGDCCDSEREYITNRINQGKCRALVATGQLIGEGFDCKRLDTLFIASPIRFVGRVTQYIGRVLRPAEGKNIAYVFDYVDSNIRVLQKSANERIKIYGKENIIYK